MFAPVSNRIKRFAIKNFDTQINEGVYMSDYDKGKTQKPSISQDHDILIRQIIPKLTYPKPRKSEHSNSIIYSLPQGQEQNYTYNLRQNSFTHIKDDQKKRNSIKTVRSRYKNFIQLSCSQKQNVEKNAAMQHRIEVLRNIKLELDNNDKKRSQFFSSNHSNYQGKQISAQSYYQRKNDTNYRKDRKKGYIPIGYNGQILQKKQNLAKYNSHFIDMEISVDPQLFFKGERKQNQVKKQTFNHNLFEKARQRKINQLLNTKNVYYAQFRSPPKKITQQQKKLQYQRRLQIFLNKSQSQQLQISLDELKQFKQIVYRRRELQYFLSQQQGIEEEKQTLIADEQQTKNNIGSYKDNTIKKEQVNIQNLKNYEELINAANQNSERKKATKNHEKKKKKLEVSFQAVKKSKFKRRDLSLSNIKSKTVRRSVTKRSHQSKGFKYCGNIL